MCCMVCPFVFCKFVHIYFNLFFWNPEVLVVEYRPYIETDTSILYDDKNIAAILI